MTKREIERMVDLIDERYLDEALEQPIVMKGSRGRLIAAAAVAAVGIGIAGYAGISDRASDIMSAPAVSSDMQEDNPAAETTVHSPLAEVELELRAEEGVLEQMLKDGIDEAAVSEQEKQIEELENKKRIEERALEILREKTSYMDKITGIYQYEEYAEINAPYEKYFQGETEAAYPVLPEADSLTYMPNAYTAPLFDFGNGEDASGLKIYSMSGVPVYADVNFILGKTHTGMSFTQSALLRITADGSCQLDYSIDSCQPQELCGVDIYGFEDKDGSTKHVFFRMNGQGYSLELGNLSCMEAASFVELLIESGISLDSFIVTDEAFTIEIP